MKHLIIINKASGNSEVKDSIINEFKTLLDGQNYEIYLTKGPKDATNYLKEYFKKEEKEIVRVYAVGGDGTINEVVNGLVGAENAELAIVPSGTGNDFIKYYDNPKDFTVENAIKGTTQNIDLSCISGPTLKESLYSNNVINFGFDAVVGAVGNKFKEMGKDKPYDRALKVAMLKARYNRITVTADGEKLNNGWMLLSSLAQGKYVGGKFKAAPKSNNQDGLIDVCVLKIMSFAHLGMIIGPYTAGKHLDKKNRVVIYRQAKHIEIDAPKDIDICIDGEMIRGKHFDVNVVPGAIKLVIPQ